MNGCPFRRKAKSLATSESDRAGSCVFWCFVLRFSMVFSTVAGPVVHPKQQWITILPSLHLCQHLLFFFKRVFKFFVYEFCLLICMCTTCMPSVHGGLKSFLIFWNWNYTWLGATIWVLGTEHRLGLIF